MIQKIKQMVAFAVAMLPMALIGQTTTENHVVSKTYKVRSQTSLSTQNPDSVATAIQYLDGLGRAKQSVLVKGGKNSYGNNQLPYDWSAGNANQSSFYNLNGSSSENQIINGTTPFGDTDLIWECVNDAATGADGGWNTDDFTIDRTKAYRYTVWVKKTGNLTDGLTCHGPITVFNLDGTSNPNPYFWLGDLPQIDTWYLMVGYIHPAGYTGGDAGISGVYDTQGNKVLDATEFKWTDTVVINRFRSYLFHATNTSTRQYFWSPVVQKIDGTEDTLSDIINNANVIDNTLVESKDIVTHVEYDNLGRQTKEFLPYASGFSDGRINSHAGLKTQAYYQDNYSSDFAGVINTVDVNSYSEKMLESSPLGRILEQTAPGEDWKIGNNTIAGKGYSDGHSIRFEHDSNTTNEVKNFLVSLTFADNTYTPSISQSGYYGVGELTKTITKDENWNVSDALNKTTEEFKNKQGQVVLKRTYNNSQAHDTYYVYDDYGNLTYVLPPKAADQTINSTVLDELCYQYKYDQRNRLVEKKIPGKGWEYIVYDKLDRPVLTQDANLRTTQDWLFTKYDAMGRVVYTGIFHNGRTRLTMQPLFEDDLPQNMYEDRTTTQISLGGAVMKYTNKMYPTDANNLIVHTVNYYDSYTDLPSGFTAPTTVYDQPITTNTKGMATVSKVRVLENANWITTLTYYDELARPVYVYSYNDYLQTTDIIESKLDFTGKVLETKTTHKKTGKADIVTVDVFEYDHQDRLISQTQKVNNQFPERLVRNNYDDLGQLKSKLTGNGTQAGFKDVTNGISITDNVITKNGGSGSSWNNGLATLGNFSRDGYLEYEVITTNNYYMVGLSSSNIDAHYSTLDFAIYARAGDLKVYESGADKGLFGTYDTGDILRLERIGNKIFYKKNGEIFYISTSNSSGSLLGDISIASNGVQIKNLHIVDNSKGLQNVDYNYNVRGWLTNINQDTQNDNDLFNFTLRYNNPTSGTALFNGNIAQTSWNTANTDSSTKTYTYSYDALNRITSGIDNTGNYNLTSVSYDKNGNILNLQRQGHLNSNATLFGAMDNLSYTYDSGNKLYDVTDSANKDFGFKDGTNAGYVSDFAYDSNGNMTYDLNKGITSISYNHLNLPVSITFSNGGHIGYVYDASGVKQRKEVETPSEDPFFTYYAGNFIYEAAEGESPDLQFFNHAEGYAKVDVISSAVEISYVYQYKDHLGNVRLTYADTDNSGDIDESTEIIEESNYYPFGLKHKGYNNVVSSNGNSVAQKFKYNGFEFNDELGLNLYDYGWRLYDPSIGRWNGVDPYSEIYDDLSPYNYALNSPLNVLDPDGRLVVYVNGFRTSAYAKYLKLKAKQKLFGGPDPQKPWNHTERFYKTDTYTYWGGFDINFRNKGEDALYVDGMFMPKSTGTDRFQRGLREGKILGKKIMDGEITLEKGELIKLVGHSHGGAHAMGMARGLLLAGVPPHLIRVFLFAPHQPNQTQSVPEVDVYQFSRRSDRVSSKGFYKSKMKVIEDALFYEMPEGNEDNLGSHGIHTYTAEELKKAHPKLYAYLVEQKIINEDGTLRDDSNK